MLRISLPIGQDEEFPPLPDGVTYEDLRIDWSFYEEYGDPSGDVDIYYLTPEPEETFAYRQAEYEKALRDYNVWYKENKEALQAEDAAKHQKDKELAEKKAIKDKIQAEKQLQRDYEQTVKRLASLEKLIKKEPQ